MTAPGDLFIGDDGEPIDTGRPGGHARRSASESKRWLACPGSVREAERARRAGHGGSSHYAQLGTAAHHLAALCLERGVEASSMLGWVIHVREGERPTQAAPITAWVAEVAYRGKHGVPESEPLEWQEYMGRGEFVADRDMVEAVQLYLDVVERELEEARLEAEDALGGVVVLHEERLSLEWLRPNMWGTCDTLICLMGRRLTVIDYKHGQGVAVEVEANEQLMYYAVGAAHRIGWDFEEARLGIVQPRCPHPDGPERWWHCSKADLRAFAERLAAGADATDAPDAPLHAGAHCRFCAAASAGCREFADEVFRQAQLDFGEVPGDGDTVDAIVVAHPGRTPEEWLAAAVPEGLSGGELALRLQVLPLLNAFVKRTREMALRELAAGRTVPGFKLVAGKVHRVWRPGAQEDLLALGFSEADLYHPREARSPSDVEKHARPMRRKLVLEAVAALAVKPPPRRLSVAPESDPRPPADPALAAAADFPALAEGDGGEEA